MRSSPNACNCGSTSAVPIVTAREAYVWCICCKAEGPHLPTQEEAEAAWNQENPTELFTERFWEPWPGDGVYRVTIRTVTAAELAQYTTCRRYVESLRMELDVYVKIEDSSQVAT